MNKRYQNQNQGHTFRTLYVHSSPKSGKQPILSSSDSTSLRSENETIPKQKNQITACSNIKCRTIETPLWRKGWTGSDGKRVHLCNACGLHYKKKHYCPYCIQIYREWDTYDHQSPWIPCRKCNRWMHRKCYEMSFRNVNDIDYININELLCPDCILMDQKSTERLSYMNIHEQKTNSSFSSSSNSYNNNEFESSEQKRLDHSTPKKRASPEQEAKDRMQQHLDAFSGPSKKKRRLNREYQSEIMNQNQFIKTPSFNSSFSSFTSRTTSLPSLSNLVKSEERNSDPMDISCPHNNSCNNEGKSSYWRRIEYLNFDQVDVGLKLLAPYKYCFV